jgi:hypothetical protein
MGFHDSFNGSVVVTCGQTVVAKLTFFRPYRNVSEGES